MVEEVNKVVKAKSSRSWGRAKVAAHVILKMGGGGGAHNGVLETKPQLRADQAA